MAELVIHRSSPRPQPPARPERIIALDTLGAVGDAARPLGPIEPLPESRHSHLPQPGQLPANRHIGRID